MRVLVDTPLLLNDFFYRYPDMGVLRTGQAPPPALTTKWQACHEALLKLSLEREREIYVMDYTLLRLVTILSDLKIPAAVVLEELSYWNSQFQAIPLSAHKAEHLLEQAKPQMSDPDLMAEEILLASTASNMQIDFVLSPVPHAHPSIMGVSFRQPEAVLGL